MLDIFIKINQLNIKPFINMYDVFYNQKSISGYQKEEVIT